MKLLPVLSLAAISAFLVSCASLDDDAPTKRGPLRTSIAQSPEQAIANMELPPGYRLETVLAEPQIEEPVLAVFDGNGVMYVAEMRTYMQDADATGEMDPTSRVSRHEDTNGDGTYDRHTIFADNLLLPRIVLPLDDRVVIGETNTLDLYVYRDSDGDGVADEKELWFEGGPRGGNLEHQPSGMIWAQDNWLYSTYNDYRLRFTNGRVEKEEIPQNWGQWGLSQDDQGKVWYVDAGGEQGPVHYQQHIPYGKFSIDGQESNDFRVVWPIDNVPDTQGGRFQLRDDNSLNHFTATCGQDIFRGDRLPADLRGDLLFAEPVGRLIRRARISVEDGVTHLENAYHENEFIRTKDPLFRPVNMATAPDGTLYIVDMYRGIIQEGNWTKKGSYLRSIIDETGLGYEIGKGRIYRLVYDGIEPGPQPRMLEETSEQLVERLSHANGWWRDTAQKLLVLRNDETIVPQLESLFMQSDDPIARGHALWTLEGLEKLKPELVRQALSDPEVSIRHHGIRLSEPFLTGEASIREAVIALLSDSEPQVVIQAMLSLKRSNVPDAQRLTSKTAEASSSKGVFAINEQLWEDAGQDAQLMAVLGSEGLKSYRKGKAFYESLCFACHGPDGQGTPAPGGKTLAPPLFDSPRVLGSKQAGINIVLHGLQGFVDGVDYGAPMISMASYSDEELANVLTYIRNSFGNRSDAVLPTEVEAVRAENGERKLPWTIEELESHSPVIAIPSERFAKRGDWKLSASHETEQAALAADADLEMGYETKRTPYVGMWFQVELPETSSIKKITLDARVEDEEVIGWPLAYEVQVSIDGIDWSDPVASGRGEPFTQIHLSEVTEAKFLKITMTEKNSWKPWIIHNLEIYGKES